ASSRLSGASARVVQRSPPVSLTLTTNAGAALTEFIATSLDSALAGADDVTAAEAQTIALFHSVARDVPAYRDFLRAHSIHPETVRTFADFQQLPLITKTNYHSQYPLEDLCRGGRLEANDFVAVSSGSTGQPTFWPRFLTDELTIARRFEQAFYDSFHA